mmetsp:Transcript_34088/g.54677  ORF Transcript_34088/g.54677 Transcript_34088/m.54677 type:complete len:251 (-) Transcript_34088:17-769(-)
MHQALDPPRDFHERAEGLDGLDDALDLLTLLDRLHFAHALLGGLLLLLARLELLLTLRLLGRERLHLLSAGRGLHGEREPPLGGVDGLYPHLHFLVFSDHVAHVLHEAVGELGDVHEAVRGGAEVHEASIFLDALHFSGVLIANGDVCVLHRHRLLNKLALGLESRLLLLRGVGIRRRRWACAGLRGGLLSGGLGLAHRAKHDGRAARLDSLAGASAQTDLHVGSDGGSGGHGGHAARERGGDTEGDARA